MLVTVLSTPELITRKLQINLQQSTLMPELNYLEVTKGNGISSEGFLPPSIPKVC